MLLQSFETKQMLEAILNSIDEAIHVVNADGITVFYNEVASRHDGVEVEEVIGKHVLEIFPSLNRETSTLLKVIESGNAIYQQPQTFKNIKGQLIDTVNTTLPIKLDGKIIGAVEIAKDLSTVRQLSQKLADLQARVETKQTKPIQVSGAKYHWSDIITACENMESVKKRTQRAADTSSPIMIYGETGTGKELFVQSIHNSSSRKSEVFIAQNCAALPANLLESILFGTKKGSFTGAIDRPGLFELAHGGTLFLDEINSMPLEIQAKLLRVLEDGVIRRVGGTSSYRIDVRVIAALNEHPNSCMEKQRLRQDLYYRLNVFLIEIPPLRTRKGDIPLLVDHFRGKYSDHHKKKVPFVDNQVLDYLENQNWPGNVRELEHTIEYAMNMVDGNTITMEHLPPYMMRNLSPKITQKGNLIKPLRSTLEQTEINLIKQALKETNGSITNTAKILEVPRQTLQYKMNKHGIGKGD